jgi:hypothetical protein
VVSSLGFESCGSLLVKAHDCYLALVVLAYDDLVAKLVYFLLRHILFAEGLISELGELVLLLGCLLCLMVFSRF